MSDNKKGFDWSFSNKAVDERVNSGRDQMKGTKEKKVNDQKPGKPSGHLDTQIFPNKKKPYHE